MQSGIMFFDPFPDPVDKQGVLPGIIEPLFPVIGSFGFSRRIVCAYIRLDPLFCIEGTLHAGKGGFDPSVSAKKPAHIFFIHGNMTAVDNFGIGLPIVRPDLVSKKLGQPGNRSGTGKRIEEPGNPMFFFQLPEKVRQKRKKRPFVPDVRDQLRFQIGVIKVHQCATIFK